MTTQSESGDRPEDDPTGIRALLGSLPDPGPMPPDVARRITESIAAERAAMGPGHSPGPVVAPLVRRRPLWQKVGLVAAAAVVVGVAGSALTGTGPGDVAAFISHGGSNDSAASSADSADSAPESAGDAAAGSGSDTDSSTDGGALPTPGAEPEAAPGRALSAAVTDASGTAYVTSAFSAQAGEALRRWMLGSSTKSLADLADTPLSTLQGVRDCLKGIQVDPDRLLGSDLATFDGTPAAVIVLKGSAGTNPEAYAVERDCAADRAGVLAGPVDLP